MNCSVRTDPVDRRIPRGWAIGAFQAQFRGCHAAAETVQSAPVLQIVLRSKIILGALACLSTLRCSADEIIPQPLQVVISVAEQKLVVLRDGGVVSKYPISTSKFGLGDSFGSYKTPLGQLRVCEKVGGEFATGTVIKHRSATGEVLAVNAAGRDPIVTRILWLDGQEVQNRNARSRGIYIHGTTEEKRIGDPVSYGCIRMRSRDVIELFAAVPVGTPINIVAAKLPKLRKYVPAPTVMIASNPLPVGARAGETPTRYAANGKPAKPERLSEIASGPAMIPADPGAALSLKGSILSAGLPDAAQKAGPLKQDSMRFQSWSAISLRDPDHSGKTAGTH